MMKIGGLMTKRKKYIDYVVKTLLKDSEVITRVNSFDNDEIWMWAETPFGEMDYDKFFHTLSFLTRWESEWYERFYNGVVDKFGATDYDVEVIWLDYSLGIQNMIE